MLRFGQMQVMLTSTIALTLYCAGLAQTNVTAYGTVKGSPPGLGGIYVNGTPVPPSGMVFENTTLLNSSSIEVSISRCSGAQHGYTESARFRRRIPGPAPTTSATGQLIYATSTAMLLIEARVTGRLNGPGYILPAKVWSRVTVDTDPDTNGDEFDVYGEKTVGNQLFDSGVQRTVIGRTVIFNQQVGSTWYGDIWVDFDIAMDGRLENNEPEGQHYFDSTGLVRISEVSATINVKRQGSTNPFSTSARVAAGSKDTNEHKAQVEITALSAGLPLAGVRIPPPKIVEGNGVSENATITMNNNGVTDANGKATGVYRSSDVVSGFGATPDPKPVALELYTSGAVRATLYQSWDETYGWRSLLGFVPYIPYFVAEEPTSVCFLPKFIDGTTQVPITSHTMNFGVHRVKVLVWDAAFGYRPVIYTADPTEANNWSNPPVLYLPSLATYAEFNPASVMDTGGGVHCSDLTVKATPGNLPAWIVDSLLFYAQDPSAHGKQAPLPPP